MTNFLRTNAVPLASIVVAVCSLFVAVLSLRYTENSQQEDRAYKELMLRPVLQTVSDTDTASIVVANTGLGPAKISRVLFHSKEHCFDTDAVEFGNDAEFQNYIYDFAQAVKEYMFVGMPVDPSLHEEFSRLFRENCTYLGIGAGFTSDDRRSDDGAPGRVRDDTGTVVLAEPTNNSGFRCFAIMPFGEREASRSKGFFDEVLKALIAPAGRDAGFEVITANREGSNVIHATIVNQLLDADLVVADLTENNPNVLFELGLRIAEDKPIALIRSKGREPSSMSITCSAFMSTTQTYGLARSNMIVPGSQHTLRPLGTTEIQI
ncbi:hypothetical protein ACE10Z_36140 [Bradyrhizobium sp. Pha-3]|uniref:hypothetical protein n=1 Tax=Bradyrhizobium sp. Pha-3 TaxID=208375 RepID=UPI0035D40D53